MTVLEVIQRSADYLAKKGVESPRLQIELLLAHQLKLPRLQLYLNFDRVLSPADINALREQVTRRGERVPLQHLVGSVSFCGLEIGVGPEVLIPRPETELLAERAIRCLNERAAAGATSLRALDFGTGSGCLALLIAARCPAVEMHAVDVSPAALERARDNARKLSLDSRVTFHLGDGFSSWDSGRPLDLLVSNPPYIPTDEIPQLQPEVRDFDPHLALDGGQDGLTFYRRLASEGPRYMNSGGSLLLELGDGQGESVQELLLAENWVVDAILPDYSSRPRVLVARRH